MTFTTHQAILDALPGRTLSILKTGVLSNSTDVALSTLWRLGGTPPAGALPPTGAGEVPTSATPGALPIVAPGTGLELYLAGGQLGCDASSTSPTVLILDRLVHASGIVTNITTPQTVNSVAVSRPNADADGTLLFLEVFTGAGTTDTVATVSYTNQAGTAGRTGTVTFVGTPTINGLTPVKLEAPDTGVRSVETVTFSASTGTAGNLGILIARPVTMFPSYPATRPSDGGGIADWLDLLLVPIAPDACLMLAQGVFGVNSDYVGYIHVIEG